MVAVSQPADATHVRSMTGFGAGEAPVPGGRVVVELKSVNHRYLDVTVKAPREYAALEGRIVEAVRGRLRRGKADVYISRLADTADPSLVQADLPLAKALHRALSQIQWETKATGDVSLAVLANWREIVSVGGAPPDPEQDWQGVSRALGAALERISAMRSAEGDRLAADVLGNAAQLRRLAGEARARAPKVVEDHRAKLQERLAKLLGDATLDRARLEQEVAILADRTDVHEELVRLDSHLDQLETTVKKGGDIGRRLDFLLQEIGRETNTLGSKANDPELAKIVVELKSVAERIREQIQNLE